MPKSNLSEDTAQLFVLGLPKGQPRVKAYARGGRAGVYDPGTADAWKNSVAMAATAAGLSGREFVGGVDLSIAFAFPRPKAHFGRGGWLKGSAPWLHTSRPDADNLLKAVMDALTDVRVWRDDAQVHGVCVSKRYANHGDSPHAVITLGFQGE